MRVRTAFAGVLATLGVLVGSLALTGAPAFAFFGHPYLSQITEVPGGPAPGSLASPWGMTFDSAGNLFLADPGRQIVDVFDSTNTFKTQAGHGFLSGGYARSVAVDDATGDVYVGDSNNSEVFVMKPDGKGGYEGLSAWKGANSKPGTFGGGCCYVYTAVDNSPNPGDAHKGDVYVLTTQNVIDIFSPKHPGPEEAQEGELVGELAAPGGFSFGAEDGLAVAPTTGEVYVADPGNKAVDEFSSSGAYSTAITGSETPAGAGSFRPVSVSVEESTGDVYAVDAASKVVDQFDNTGKYVGQIAETSTGPLQRPQGVAVNSNGDVYVSDSEPRAVDIFGPATQLPDVTTGAATEVKKTSAKLEGIVNPDGEEVTGCGFEYGTNTAYGHTVACSPAPGSGSSPVPLAAELSGLTQETTYHYRVVAGNAKGVNSGADRTFTTSSAVDSLQTEAATNVEKSSGTIVATLNGSLAPDGSDTHYFFEYGETDAYGSVSPALPGTDAGSASKLEHAQTSLTSLNAGTTYHFRLVGANSFGTSDGADMTFTTPIAVEGLLTGVATEVQGTSTTLNGSLEPNGVDARCWFEYGLSESYGSTTPHEDAGEASEAKPVRAALASLEPNTVYHFRLAAENVFGATFGSDETLRTQALPPLVGQSSTVSAITRVTAVVSASVDPEKSATTFHIVYGETGNYGQHTIEFEAGAGLGEQEFPVGLQGLTPEKTYHYAVVATNQAGAVTGPDETFTTAAATSPAATTGDASGVTLTTATVSGTIDARGLETSYELDLGTDTTYGTSIYGEAGSAGEPIGVSIDLQDLAPGTAYHYRIVAVNSDGKTCGADQTFTTPAYSAPIVLPFALPLLQTPAIAFPAESSSSAVKKATKKKTTKKRKRHVKPKRKTKKKKK